MGNTVSNEDRRRSQSKHSSHRTRFNSISTYNSVGKGSLKSENQQTILGRFKHKQQRSISTEEYVNNPYPLIEKYTDSQMTLLNHSPPNNKPLVGTLYDNHSISTIHSNSTTTTTSNTNSPISQYSSELVLKELYMSSETSPERRRDRDRRHRQHYLTKRIWKSNYRIPLNNPTLIIDWCCATAVWDIELAFEFPNAKIVGIDYESVTVSSLTNTVKNFSFQNANIHEGDLGFQQFQDNSVDYIMMRDVWLVNSSPEKWKNVFKQVYRVLKPGGYIEIYEQDLRHTSLGPSFTILAQWSNAFFEAIQYDTGIVNELDTYLQETGFTNIKKEAIDLPIGEWSETLESKETGYLQKDMIERHYRESKRWLCACNHISEKEYTNVLVSAMDECEEYKTSTKSLSYAAQKP